MSSDPKDGQQSEPGPQFEYNPYDLTGSPTEAPGSEHYGPQFSGAFMPPIPPLPGYDQPMATPLPLGEALQQLPRQYVKVTTRPGARSFAEEMGKAEWGIIWLQLVIYAAISGALSFLSYQLNPVSLNPADYPTLPPDTLQLVEQVTTYTSGFGTFVGVVVGFFIFQGISYGLAKLFKGQGNFMTQCYTALLFQVPLGIAGALVGFIPILGILGSLALNIYSLVLQAFSIMAVHRLSGGKATGVVLIPFGVLIFLACCFVFALLAFAVSNAGLQR
jgi:hypothetical protein